MEEILQQIDEADGYVSPTPPGDMKSDLPMFVSPTTQHIPALEQSNQSLLGEQI